jgi:hypothetical protein
MLMLHSGTFREAGDWQLLLIWDLPGKAGNVAFFRFPSCRFILYNISIKDESRSEYDDPGIAGKDWKVLFLEVPGLDVGRQESAADLGHSWPTPQVMQYRKKGKFGSKVNAFLKWSLSAKFKRKQTTTSWLHNRGVIVR